MSALPIQEVLTAPANLPLSVNDRLVRIASKSKGETVQADVAALWEYVNAKDMDLRLRANITRAGFDSVRKAGLDTIIRQTVEMRKDWRNHLTEKLVDAQASGIHLTRKQLIEEVKGHCFYRRYKGKNGEQIKLSTIKKWLTLELENDIRQVALTMR